MDTQLNGQLPHGVKPDVPVNDAGDEQQPGPAMTMTPFVVQPVPSTVLFTRIHGMLQVVTAVDVPTFVPPAQVIAWGGRVFVREGEGDQARYVEALAYVVPVEVAPEPAPRRIQPTVGRVVLYHPSHVPDKKQPYPALITHVWSEQCVNLEVSNDGSFPLPDFDRLPTSVTLLMPDEPAPLGGAFARWMPFQQGQAAKTEAAEGVLQRRCGDLARAVAHLAAHVANDGSRIRDEVTNCLLGEAPRDEAPTAKT